MKKILILVLILFVTTSCTKEEPQIKKEKVTKKEEVVEKDTYKDNNTTPISLYKLEGNTLVRQTTITKHLSSMEDIDIFQVYPSTEDNIKVTNYATDFYNEYSKYNENNNLKIGFQIDYTANNEEISYLILNPTNAMEKWEYIMGYLYDDYLNKDKSFYSHIEEGEYTDNNLISSIKLQGGYQVDKITSNIDLTVFTYDSEDDFDNNKYRGNSKYTLTIIPE